MNDTKMSGSGKGSVGGGQNWSILWGEKRFICSHLDILEK